MVGEDLGGTPRSAEGASYAPDDRRWTAFVQWLDLVAVYRLLRGSGGVIRVGGERWPAVSLSALDGDELGAIQLFDKAGGAFSADDEAALVHLAQMASAAVDRALLYRNWR